MALLILLAIALLAFTTGVVLVVGVVEAPWPILLLILVGGLVAMQRLSMQRSPSADLLADVNPFRLGIQPPQSPSPSESQRSDNPSPQSSDVPPQASSTSDAQVDSIRTYRGVSYDQKTTEPSAVPLTDDAPFDGAQTSPPLVEGTYRGQHWQHPRMSSPAETSQVFAELTYRGVKIKPVHPESTDAERPNQQDTET